MKKKKKYFGVLSVVAVVSAVLMAAIFLFQLNNYEKAFLDIYGVEQDGYVKVTLDQIGRLGEDATEEKITDIISSLDSDSSKYWTLSTGDNILFIKSRKICFKLVMVAFIFDVGLEFIDCTV